MSFEYPRHKPLRNIVLSKKREAQVAMRDGARGEPKGEEGEARMSYRVVPNRTPPPLLVPIRPPYPKRSSATGFVAIAGGIVIGCQMRARPLLNLPKLHHAESVTAAPTV